MTDSLSLTGGRLTLHVASRVEWPTVAVDMFRFDIYGILIKISTAVSKLNVKPNGCAERLRNQENSYVTKIAFGFLKKEIQLEF